MAVLTDLFILSLLLFLWCWDYPVDHPPRRLVHWLSLPFLYLGLWHSWAMFAPQPIHVNRRLRAVIRHDDGSSELWTPIGPHRSALFNLLYARSFKYECSLLSTAGPAPLRALAEFLAKRAAEDAPERRVVRVELVRESCRVNPPEDAEIHGPVQVTPLLAVDVNPGAVAC
ncbi:MAG: hypothetical protein RLZZ436_3755 [Planctomycetota bacterium]|jgi:hypothetical protein